MKQLLADELQAIGFETTVYTNGILVSLKNRKPSTMEVDTAIRQVLDDCTVGCRSVAQGVFIGTVGMGW